MSNEFHMNRLARQMALGEVFEESEMSAGDLLYQLGYNSNKVPEDLPIRAPYWGMTGADLMKVVNEYEKGFKSVMEVAYTAGRDGRRIV